MHKHDTLSQAGGLYEESLPRISIDTLLDGLVDPSLVGPGGGVLGDSPSPAARHTIPDKLKTFHGQENNKPPVVYKKEKAIHRRILFLKAHGLSNIEVAEMVGMTPVGVGLVTRQEWFREALVELMNETGVDGVKELIKGAAMDSVMKIITLRDTAQSEAVQRDCAFDLMDRYLGKAVQPIGESGKKPLADEARLDAEIAELQKKLNPMQN